MIADLLVAAIEYPFVTGLLIGGAGFGGSLSIIGWCLGYGHAMRKVESWMRPNLDAALGDVPNLPPARERRHIVTTPGRFV